MNIFKKRIVSILMATIMVFLANTMIPFFATYNQEISLINPDDTILICHGDGFAFGTSKDIPTSEKTDYQCPSCYVSAHGIKNLSLTYDIPVFYEAFLEKPFSNLKEPFFISGLLSHDYIDSHAPPVFL